MIELILYPGITEMLKEIENVFTAFGIDYYVVGAVARDIQLSADPGAAAVRKTKDVDLAVLVNDEGQFNQLKAALITTGSFTEDAGEPIKLFYKKEIEVDLLPFGAIEGPNRNVEFTAPSFILNMPGFLEIYPFVNSIQVTDTMTIKVCTIEGIVLLKLISNNDRPQRTKDITDIEHIVRVYFDLYSGNIYEEYFDIMDRYETGQCDYLKLVCSRVIGRKIGILLAGSDDLRERIKQILNNRPTAWWQAMLDGLNDDFQAD